MPTTPATTTTTTTTTTAPPLEGDELTCFAHILNAFGCFEDEAAVIYYFEKPWKWKGEHALWNKMGRPDTGDRAAFSAFEEALFDLMLVANEDERVQRATK